MEIRHHFKIDRTYSKDIIMRALATFLHRLLGPAEEDHLTGAVDLSDSAYCFSLLNWQGTDENAEFFPQCIEAAAGLHSAHQSR
jgi:hypothetical protein